MCGADEPNRQDRLVHRWPGGPRALVAMPHARAPAHTHAAKAAEACSNTFNRFADVQWYLFLCASARIGTCGCRLLAPAHCSAAVWRPPAMMKPCIRNSRCLLTHRRARAVRRRPGACKAAEEPQNASSPSEPSAAPEAAAAAAAAETDEDDQVWADLAEEEPGEDEEPLGVPEPQGTSFGDGPLDVRPRKPLVATEPQEPLPEKLTNQLYRWCVPRLHHRCLICTLPPTATNTSLPALGHTLHRQEVALSQEARLGMEQPFKLPCCANTCKMCEHCAARRCARPLSTRGGAGATSGQCSLHGCVVRHTRVAYTHG